MAAELPDLGEQVDVDALKAARAASLAAYLQSTRPAYARLVGAHRDAEGIESVLIDLDVEVPQNSVHPIADVEPVAIRFAADDRRVPEVLALRHGFPRVPHLNLTPNVYPKSLCLYEQPWNELRLHWTPALFVERIREWMALTARGELHGADQPLEPILLEWDRVIIVPIAAINLARANALARLYVDEVPQPGERSVYVARTVESPPKPGSLRRVATVVRCEPREHGIIERAPKTLEDLHSLAASGGLDLKRHLHQLLKSWHGQQDILDAQIVVFLWIPKMRAPGASPDSGDFWGFELTVAIRTLGVLLESWGSHDGHLVPLLETSNNLGSCDSVGVSVLRPMLGLDGDFAARLNGMAGDDRRIAAVGGGALGSQIFMNLFRSGFGTWTLIDNDRFYPHNLARHALDAWAVGWPKAQALSHHAARMRDSEEPPAAIVADVLDPQDSAPDVQDAFAKAAIILDMSASVPVARALVRSHSAGGRRISLFLNPSGTDMVLLAEDEERSVRLDQLEHQFYRALLRDPRLARHYEQKEVRVRYAQSCRDLSSTLPQHLVGMHAAIGSKAIRNASSQPQAALRVWRSDPECQVQVVDVETSATREQKVGSWTVCADEAFYAMIRSLRESKLPNETGGVLIGSFDLDRRIVYLVDIVTSPPDSQEWPTLYIRGSEGLGTEVRRISSLTMGMLHYVGEWHSHPRGAPAVPSEDDRKVFLWLAELMGQDGLPPVMLIAGDTEEAVFVETIGREREPS